jgi:hypothetical protein
LLKEPVLADVSQEAVLQLVVDFDSFPVTHTAVEAVERHPIPNSRHKRKGRAEVEGVIGG